MRKMKNERVGERAVERCRGRERNIKELNILTLSTSVGRGLTGEKMNKPDKTLMLNKALSGEQESEPRTQSRSLARSRSVHCPTRLHPIESVALPCQHILRYRTGVTVRDGDSEPHSA